MRRPLAILAACYITTRVLLVVYTGPLTSPDTISYRTVSFVGGAPRPWLVPLVNWFLSDELVVAFQAAASAVAFLVLAVALAKTIDNPNVRMALMAVVLLIGMNPRVVRWDSMVLADSLAITTTVLMIAALTHLRRMLERHPVLLVTLVAAWTFARDAHTFLLIPLGAGIAIAARRQPVVAVAVVATFVWAYVAGQNDRYIEGFNATTHIAFTFDGNPQAIDWFVAHGMPDVPALDEPDSSQRFRDLWADDPFYEWATRDGADTYARYLMAHPVFALGAIRYLVEPYPGHGAMLDLPFQQATTPATTVAWPARAVPYTLALALFAFGLAWRAGWSRRYLVSLLLIGSTVPHAYLAFHGSGLELLRHSVELQIVLVVNLWWLLAVAIDRLVQLPIADRTERENEARKGRPSVPPVSVGGGEHC